MRDKLAKILSELSSKEKIVIAVILVIVVGVGMFAVYNVINNVESDAVIIEENEDDGAGEYTGDDSESIVGENEGEDGGEDAGEDAGKNAATENSERKEDNDNKNEKSGTGTKSSYIYNGLTEENVTSVFGTKSTESVVVHVIGEVVTPGVIKLPAGSRIIDAITACGGKTEEADVSKINLAYVIEDGCQIYIPKIGEKSDKVLVQTEAGENVIIDGAAQEDDETKETKVNINTANLEKLQTLPGVGESTAQKIIEYREQKGKFNTIDELKNVNGIGESKFNQLKDYVYVK